MDKTLLAPKTSRRLGWRRAFRFIVLVNMTTFVFGLNRQRTIEATASRGNSSKVRDAPSIIIDQRQAKQVGVSPTDSTRSTGNNQPVETNALVSILSNLDLGAKVLAKHEPNLELNKIQMYLQKYGYMNAHTNLGANNLISEESFSNAVASFQRFAGIPVTGECFS